MSPQGAAPTPGSSALDRHVPALDGLRAISVVAVLLYHARLGGADSGFLGVSQFFTLSGFLVMSILLRGIDRDDLRLRRFWGRRYRRLLPAAMLTLAGATLFGVAVGTEQQLDDLVTSIPAAVLQVANWHFVVTDTSYVQLFAAPSPVQHFWSLAIEEQFYLVVPLLLLGIRAVTRSAAALVALIAAAAGASTVWMWVLFERGASIDRLYYGTDTRASELLVGCALAAVVWWHPPSLGPRARRALGVAGSGAFAVTTVAFFTMSVSDPSLYRGGYLAYSLLTALVIFGAVHDAGPVAAVLRIRPLPALGRLSYGIYLFHWPLILLLTEDRVGIAGWPLFALQAGTSVVLAAMSASWFENPIRRGEARPGDLRFPIAVGIAAVALIAGGTALGAVDRETDLAGLGDEVGNGPPPADGPVRLLVVSDGTTTDWIDDELAASSPDLELVAVAPARPFDWVDAARRSDADVVLLELNRGLDPLDDDREAVRGAIHALDRADVAVAWRRFVERGAPLTLSAHPVVEGIREAAAELPNLAVLPTNSDADAVAVDLVRLARADTAAAPRVLIVGDSVSRTIGHGLERWGGDTGRASVWSAGTEGCGLVAEGWTVDATGRERPAPAECRAVAEAWRDQLAAFEPEIVLVSSNAVDFRLRRIEGWETPLRPGDSLFDAFLVDRYSEVVETLASTGARVRWITPPCAVDAFGVFDEPDGGSPLDRERLAHVRNEILPSVADAHPALEFFDLDSVLCPAGEMLTEVGGVGVLRPDGIHFSVQGSRWLADNHGDALLFGSG